MKEKIITLNSIIVLVFLLVFRSNGQAFNPNSLQKEKFQMNHVSSNCRNCKIQNSRNNYCFHYPTLQKAIDDLYSNFQFSKTGNDTPTHLDKFQVKISLAEIKTMMTDIFNYKDAANTIIYHPNDSDVAAIRFWYGLDNGKWAVIFEPIILRPNGKISQYKEKQYNILTSIATPEAYYRFNSSNIFSLIKGQGTTKPIDLVKALAADYISHIYITHYEYFDNGVSQDVIESEGDHQFHHNEIENDDYDYNDTKSSVMPLQQILKMYYDNKIQNFDYMDKIRFTLVASNKFFQNHSRILNFKPHIVVDYNLDINSKPDPNAPSSYLNVAADYTELCPPNCEDGFINN